MTFLASPLQFTFSEFAFMKIGMTITAGRELKRLALLTRIVALIAGNGSMSAFERIFCPAVVKLGLIGDMPAISRVAVLTIIAELSFVNIGMAVCAQLETQAGESGKTRVGR
jgi:hypothetical protein